MTVKRQQLPKVLPAKIPTQKRFVANYVALLSGLLGLTGTELLVLTAIVWPLHIGKSTSVVFSPEGRNKIRLNIENTHKKMTPQNFNNYLMALKRKGAIEERNGEYNINPWLYPREEIKFTYKVHEDITKYI